MLHVTIEGFHCQSCGSVASKDYQSGDSCHDCGGIVRIETSCAWCAELVPEAKFCRSCGFEMVDSKNYAAARMLKDAGVDKLELKSRLDALSDGDREHFTQQYDRLSAGISTLLDEMRACESALSGFGIGFVKPLHAKLLAAAPFSKERSEQYANLPKGPFETNIDSLSRIAKESPIESTRLVAKMALLTSVNQQWAEENNDKVLLSLFNDIQQAVETFPEHSLALLQVISNWRFYTETYRKFWFNSEELKTQLLEKIELLLKSESENLNQSQKIRLELLKFRLDQPIENTLIESGLMNSSQSIKFHAAMALNRSDLYKDVIDNDWLLLELIKTAATKHLQSDIKLIESLEKEQLEIYINALPPRDRLPDYLHDVFIEKSKQQQENLEIIWTKLSQSKLLTERQKTKLEDIALDYGINQVVLAIEEGFNPSNRLIEYLFKNIMTIFEMPEASDILYTIEEYKEDFDRYLHHHSFNLKQVFDGLCGFAINQSHRPCKKIITANLDYEYHVLANELCTRFDRISLLPLFDESLGQMKITEDLFSFFDSVLKQLPEDEHGLWERYISSATLTEQALLKCYAASIDNKFWVNNLIRKSNTIEFNGEAQSMNESLLVNLLGNQLDSFISSFCDLLINDFEHPLCDYGFELLEGKDNKIKHSLLINIPKLVQMLDNKWYHHSKIIQLFTPVLAEFLDQTVSDDSQLTLQQETIKQLEKQNVEPDQINILNNFYQVFYLDKVPANLSNFVINYLDEASHNQIILHLQVFEQLCDPFPPNHELLSKKFETLKEAEIALKANSKKQAEDFPMIRLAPKKAEKINQWMVTTEYDQAWAIDTLSYFKSYKDPTAMLALSQIASKVEELQNFDMQYLELVKSVAKAITDRALFDPASGLMAQGSFVIEIFKALLKDDEVEEALHEALESLIEDYQLDVVHESSIQALCDELDW